jgi:outer membrane protein
MRPLRSALVVCSLVPAVALAQGKGDKDKDAKAKKAPPPAEDDVTLEAGAEPLSLASVFAVAVRVAPELEDAAFALEQARGEAAIADGRHDFTVVGGAQYQRSHGQAPVPGVPGVVTEEDVTVKSGSIGLRKLLPSNGTVEVLGQGYGETSSDGTDDVQIYTAGILFRLTQPLLAGFGPASAYGDSDRARHHRDAAAIRRTARARQYAVTVVAAYWGLALSWKKLEVARLSLELARKQQSNTADAVKTGRLARAELLPAEQAMATREQDILAAELEVVDNSLALRQLVGLEIAPAQLAVKTDEIPAVAPVEVDLAAAVAKAIEQSDELKAALVEDKGAKAALAGARRDDLPRVDLVLEGGPSGTSSPLLDPTVSPSFGRAVKELDSGYTIGANLTVEVPLGGNTTGGVAAVNRAIARDAEFEVGVTRAAVAANIARVVYSVKANLLSAKLGEKAVSLAEQNVDAEQRKFEVGKSTTAEVIRRQDELEAARLRAASATVDYHVSLARLEAATGDILSAYGLKMVDR